MRGMRDNHEITTQQMLDWAGKNEIEYANFGRGPRKRTITVYPLTKTVVVRLAGEVIYHGDNINDAVTAFNEA